MPQLSKAVGKGIKTLARDRDVEFVQRLLNLHRTFPLQKIAEDGTIGAETISAIEEFQRSVLKMPIPDGRVDLGGATIRALTSKSNGAGNPFGWDLNKAVLHLVSHAEPSPKGYCARYVRQAIEAGGVTLARTASAKDYGPSLIGVGFRLKAPTQHFKGDVVIMQDFSGHPHGHMQMYSGTKWISDFAQRDFWPGESYRNSKPAYATYRFEILGDFNAPAGASRFA